MHPNPIFRHEPVERGLSVAAERGFGVLTVAARSVLAAHVPFALDARAMTLEAHLVRSNPLARHLADGPAEALMIVSGPDGYISPDWYGVPDQVPTWNYIAVHLKGRLALRPVAELRAHLDRVSALFETRLAPKPPWRTDKMTPAVLERMMRQIVPVEMTELAVDSTFKLNQNKSAPARLGAAAALGPETPGQETAALARAMREAAD